MADLFPGPDGFLLSADDPLFQSHLRLNDYLLSQEQSGGGQPSVDAAPWKRLPRQELSPLVEAVLLRFRRLREHDADLETAIWLAFDSRRCCACFTR